MQFRKKALVELGIVALFLVLSLGAAAQDLKDDTHMVELGAFGGILIPSGDHELYDEHFTHKSFNSVAPDLGVRFAYLPLSFIGVEAEGIFAPTSVDGGDSAFIWGARGHLLVQFPARFSPFALGGWGTMGVISDDGVLGKDNDYLPHFGLGVKFFATRMFQIRLDARINLGAERETEESVAHIEVLLGAALVLGRSEEKPPEPVVEDGDRDGFLDNEDQCPFEAGVAPDGCPLKDTDSDGIEDREDQCPEQPGVAPDGCPPKDTDGDGVNDLEDKCLEEKGLPPDGCPPPDSDGDGFLDKYDQCPDQPETKNGFEDEDGCPDDLPEEVQKFSGTIEGIKFRTGKARIRTRSHKLLNRAVKVLQQYPNLKLVVRGHTDDKGDRDKNVDLSLRRAQAVKDYLVKKGIDETRISVEGLGPDEPIADNKRSKGRAQNRRIEFKIVTY